MFTAPPRTVPCQRHITCFRHRTKAKSVCRLAGRCPEIWRSYWTKTAIRCRMDFWANCGLAGRDWLWAMTKTKPCRLRGFASLTLQSLGWQMARKCCFTEPVTGCAKATGAAIEFHGRLDGQIKFNGFRI